MKFHLSLSLLLAMFTTGCASTAKHQISTKTTNSEPDSNLQTCPPGTRMATRIITGETGTAITEECVKPFSSK